MAKEKDDPCWKTHMMRGTKMKNGQKVPNCVPITKQASAGAYAAFKK